LENTANSTGLWSEYLLEIISADLLDTMNFIRCVCLCKVITRNVGLQCISFY